MNSERLREIVASFYEESPADIHANFILNTPKRQGSVARYALDALLRRELGVQSRVVHTAKTYGELEAGLTGAAPAPAAPDARASRLDGDVACGVDIELVANMPETNDYFEDAFYQSHFTKSEIAYATTQQEPRMHLAARWCAKEALKKCDPAFGDAELNTIEVALDPDGKPHLRRANGEAGQRLPYALSLTHTPYMAAAIVVAVAQTRTANLTLTPQPIIDTANTSHWILIAAVVSCIWAAVGAAIVVLLMR